MPDVTTWWQPAVRPPLGGVRGRIADLVAASPFGELVEEVTLDKWWQGEVRPPRTLRRLQHALQADSFVAALVEIFPDAWWQPEVRPPRGHVRGRIAELVAASPFGELVEVVTLDKWWQPQVIPRRLPARHQIHPDIMTRGSFEAVIVPAPDISTWWQPQVIPKRRPLFLLRPQNYSGVVIIEDVFGVPQNATRLLLVI